MTRKPSVERRSETAAMAVVFAEDELPVRTTTWTGWPERETRIRGCGRDTRT